MIKIQCENPICGASFFFDEAKNASAKKVRCPKCRGIQLLKTTTPEEEEVESWIKSTEGANDSSPNIHHGYKPVVEKIEKGKENFFSEVKKEAIPLKKKANKIASKQQTDQIGWLVIHDEFTATNTFDLRQGLNRIGRYSKNAPKDINISIKTEDKYMSRHHCDIAIKWLHGRAAYEYMLMDRKSTNGTYVNADSKLSHSEEVNLKDGDTIQIGRTKVVVKLPSTVGSSEAAEKWVDDTDYFKTIIQ